MLCQSNVAEELLLQAAKTIAEDSGRLERRSPSEQRAVQAALANASNALIAAAVRAIAVTRTAIADLSTEDPRILRQIEADAQTLSRSSS